MNASEWTEFFELLSKIMNLGGTADDKRDAVKEAAAEYGDDLATTNLEELGAWFAE
jgi:hypothetical protein